ncbi:MAG TPA: radical SAM protein [Candidatus Omnitrophota bacterium]|nr:radical SAM protein [Candidatus Omnitrophota bacterium]HQO58544.1 radical SAM protein [Candidatus Omnitrophota bacterium]HQP12171.1 radical SAM protein [Candidatus Omnitrophota bacterium]
MSPQTETLIRETSSLCPVCQKQVKAALVESGEGIFLSKNCDVHGPFKLRVSRHAWYYKNLTEYYFRVMPAQMPQKRFYIYLSNRCNLDCPICLLEPNQDKAADVSLDRFKKLIRERPGFRYYLYGAEPTLRDDLPEWIALLKKHGNLVNIHTNGIKLDNMDYLKSLKDAGLDYVSLQFDGFDDQVYMALRNRKLLDSKLKALENLEKLDMPTGLNVTIAKGLNEKEINPIIDYAVGKPFIRDVSFASVSFLGNAEKNFSSADLLMPDDVVDLVEDETKGKINRRSLYLFQKLYYAVLSIFNIRRCYNFHQLALVRDGRGGYRSFDAIYDLAAFEKKLDRFSHLATRNRTLAAGYFFLQFTMNMLSGNVKEKVQVLPLNMLLPGQKRNVKIPPKILLVSFGTVCDKYKYDADISRYCGQGFVFNRDGSLALSDSVSDMTLLKKGEAYG